MYNKEIQMADVESETLWVLEDEIRLDFRNGGWGQICI